MRQIYDLLLFSKMQSYPQEKKARLVEGPFRQRCYPELLYALANSDIDIEKIKAEVLFKKILDSDDTWK